MYLIYDTVTEEIAEQTKSISKAQSIAQLLTETFAYVNNHEYGIKIKD